jgi:BirA family transcriptional regulator, biotin operon repressor / biotin---[acetyl-CoA-carboxylase] ligase
MKLIKLNAIDSTNTFLKELHRDSELDNFTVVLAKNQINGKGQMGSMWQVEDGKNLTVSILCKNSSSFICDIFDVNVLVSVAIFEVLNELKIPNLAVKWPNDIMAENKKIGGVLIENCIKSNAVIDSIIGIGININQEQFIDLPNAASLYTITSKTFDIEKLAIQIVSKIENLMALNDFKLLWEKYESILFKKEVPVVFEDNNTIKFMGIIKGVSSDGKLNVLLENDEIKSFSLKEIKMIF